MDRNPQAYLWEAVKNLLGLAVIYYSGDWFGISSLHPSMKWVVVVYLVIATGVTAWMSRQIQAEDRKAVLAS
jgi:hypothetical protein